MIGFGSISGIDRQKTRSYGSTGGTVSVTKSSKKKTKRLRYNFKQISNQIMQAKTSNSAGKAVTKAKSKVAELLKKQRTGEYNETELRRAIIHAKRMERIARKRMHHLEEEEGAEQKSKKNATGLDEVDMEELLNGSDEEETETGFSEEELQEMMRELQRLMQEELEDASEELEENTGLDELSEELTKGAGHPLDKYELENLKKKHRSDELREIAEADMKYLRALFQQLAEEKEALSSGVSLELAGFEMPVETPQMPVMTEIGGIDLSL